MAKNAIDIDKIFENPVAFLEGVLPSPSDFKKKERVVLDPDSDLFEKRGGVVNVQPIKAKGVPKDPKAALFEAVERDHADIYKRLTGIYHDTVNKCDVVTNRQIVVIVPTKQSHPNSWIEAKDGSEVKEPNYVNYTSVLPTDAPQRTAKLSPLAINNLMDGITGAMNAQKFTYNPVLVGVDVDDTRNLFPPERLLTALRVLKANGTEWIAFEQRDGLDAGIPKPTMLVDLYHPQRKAFVTQAVPMHIDKDTIIVVAAKLKSEEKKQEEAQQATLAAEKTNTPQSTQDINKDTLTKNTGTMKTELTPTTEAAERKTFAELSREYHNKDIVEAIDFIGKKQSITEEVGIRRLAFLEAHQNILTAKETGVIFANVNSAFLQKEFPELYERVRVNMDKGSPINQIKDIVAQVNERGKAWTFDDVQKIKAQETALLTQGNPPGEFFTIRHDYNQKIAYQLNATADIKVFMENAGYKQKHSTERWPRYEKGDTVLLVTESNGYKNVKSGETGNLFKFIEAEYPKMGAKSATQHFIEVATSQPAAEMRSKAHVEWLGERTHQPATVAEGVQAVKKEFNLSDYRLEHLNHEKNYFVNQRGIEKATLDSPLFKGSIIQGNKTHRVDKDGNNVAIPVYMNNVVYPFKQSPEATNQEMTSLLQQYSKKFPVGDKMVDKLFAPGDGKRNAAWFSNIPPGGKVTDLYVVENPLDALSHYQLHKPETALYMATGGRPAAGQIQLIDEIAAKYGVQHKHLSFDNDMAGHSFDTQYLASKTQQYGLKQVPDKPDEFVVEFRQLKPEQEHALKAAVKDIPNVKKDDKGTVQVHVKTPEELSKCNKYAIEYLHNDKNLKFTKSQSKDWNDDLKAFRAQNMGQNQNRDVKKTMSKKVSP